MTTMDIATLESHLSPISREVVERAKKHAVQLGHSCGPGHVLLSLTQVSNSISVYAPLKMLGLAYEEVRRVLLSYREPPRTNQPEDESYYAIMLEQSGAAAASRSSAPISGSGNSITTGDLAVGTLAARDPLVDTILLDRQIGLYKAMEALRAPDLIMAPKLDILL